MKQVGKGIFATQPELGFPFILDAIYNVCITVALSQVYSTPIWLTLGFLIPQSNNCSHLE